MRVLRRVAFITAFMTSMALGFSFGSRTMAKAAAKQERTALKQAQTSPSRTIASAVPEQAWETKVAKTNLLTLLASTFSGVPNLATHR